MIHRRRPTSIVFLLCALLTALSTMTAGAVPVAQFRKALASVEHRLETASEASRGGKPESGETPHDFAKRVLGPIPTVEVPGQGAVRVRSARLVAALQKIDAAPLKKRAEQYAPIILATKTLREDMRGMKPGDVGGGDDPPSSYVEVRRILARPEFQSEPLPPPSPLELGWNRFLKWLADHLPKPQRGASGTINPAIIRGLFYGLGALLFGLLVYLIVQYIRNRTVNVVQRDRELAEEAMVEARDKDSLIDAAEARAKEGDFRGAFRLVYLATLVAMDTDGILRFDRSRTNWEYLRSLRGAGRDDLYRAMLPLTRDFDRLWYGYATAGPSDYRQALEYYDRLRAPSPAAAARRG
ncbi:hypothetical protein CCAX7_47380 [Capsulimonas corticalis]|uniref:Protein-glutamine gamma-glutamyltransferase-like C-terminal domain-containing protein n=1 Tax=Capsulimonas corticalis TaxID=2219043 RepID=A0A402CQ67_9BACT|nr:DUF4129 domain-containing protein [Capsulimonas corticalis]BDI32687.1 hypothetical protein CCAX7_47380 [Capsulimonas corticalis]